MGSRALRRVQAGDAILAVSRHRDALSSDSSSAGDCEPELEWTGGKADANPYMLLHQAKDANDTDEPAPESKAEYEIPPDTATKIRKKKNKKKKKKPIPPRLIERPAAGSDSEEERFLASLTAATAASSRHTTLEPDLQASKLAIELKYFDYQNELRKKYGSSVELSASESTYQEAAAASQPTRAARKGTGKGGCCWRLVPRYSLSHPAATSAMQRTATTATAHRHHQAIAKAPRLHRLLFTGHGMSMIQDSAPASLQTRAREAEYRFHYDLTYQSQLLDLIEFVVPSADPSRLFRLLREGLPFHVHTLLLYADYLNASGSGQASAGRQVLETILVVLESHFHASFQLGCSSVCYESSYENRILYTTLVRYIHALSRLSAWRACLEYTKLIIGHSPEASDPVGALCILDYYCLLAESTEVLFDSDYEKRVRKAYPKLAPAGYYWSRVYAALASAQSAVFQASLGEALGSPFASILLELNDKLELGLELPLSRFDSSSTDHLDDATRSFRQTSLALYIHYHMALWKRLKAKMDCKALFTKALLQLYTIEEMANACPAHKEPPHSLSSESWFVGLYRFIYLLDLYEHFSVQYPAAFRGKENYYFSKLEPFPPTTIWARQGCEPESDPEMEPMAHYYRKMEETYGLCPARKTSWIQGLMSRLSLG